MARDGRINFHRLEEEAWETIRIVMEKARANPEIFGKAGVDAAKVVLGSARRPGALGTLRPVEDVVKELEREG